jgi:1-acyl-sn-glycerol-3-phosphate acyltransferase
VSEVEPVRRRAGVFLWRANKEHAHWMYHVAAYAVHVALTWWGKRDWRSGRDKIPQTGGYLIVCNHISQFDPVTFGDFLIWNGRWPRYLAKVALFKSKVIGWLLRSSESVPVDRSSPHAADALIPAEERIAEGKVVVIYPEGTESKDPDLWPMTARTGAARLALRTRCPVIPAAQWGPHRVIGPDQRFPHRFFGQKFSIIVGEPLDLTEFYGLEPTRELFELVTTRIMDAITALVEELRGEKAPAGRWDRVAGERLPVVRALG